MLNQSTASGNNVGGTTFIGRTLVRLNKTAGTGGGILNEDPGNTVAIRLSIVNRNIPKASWCGWPHPRVCGVPR